MIIDLFVVKISACLFCGLHFLNHVSGAGFLLVQIFCPYDLFSLTVIL